MVDELMPGRGDESVDGVSGVSVTDVDTSFSEVSVDKSGVSGTSCGDGDADVSGRS